MLGIVSDSEFEKEINKTHSIKPSRVDSFNSNSSDESNESQREVLDSNSQSNEINESRLAEPRWNIQSDSAQHELESNESLCGKIIDIKQSGRKNGDNNVPESLRKLIGAESIENGRGAGLGLANSFGISPSSVSAYSHGSTSDATYNQPNPSLHNHIQNTREKVTRKARNKLLLALNSLNSDNISQSKARDIASIAKDMSAVVKNMEEKTIGLNESGPKFIFYSPTFRSEQSFEVINVKE